MGLKQWLQWWGLTLYGIPPLLAGILLIILSVIIMFEGGWNLLGGPLMLVFVALPSFGVGLWLWDEATSHGKR